MSQTEPGRRERQQHMAINVEIHRLGGSAPACDGADCSVCRVLAQEPPDPAGRTAQLAGYKESVALSVEASEIEHEDRLMLEQQITALTTARDFQRQRADRGWALYERTLTELIDLRDDVTERAEQADQQIAALQAAALRVVQHIESRWGRLDADAKVSGWSALRALLIRADAQATRLVDARSPSSEDHQ